MKTLHERWREIVASRTTDKGEVLKNAAELRAIKRAMDAEAGVVPPAQRPKCLYCGKTLRLYKGRAHVKTDSVYGDYGDGLFCGLRCGHWFAVDAVRMVGRTAFERKE